MEKMQAVIDWCMQYQLNIEPGRLVDPTGGKVYFLRLRPWKNDKVRPVMYYGYGKTLEIAARMACKMYADGKHMELSYGYKPWQPAGTDGDTGDSPVTLPF